MIIEKNTKAMTLPYEMLENPKVLDCYKRATEATLNDTHGVEGFINSGFSLLEKIISAIVGLSLIVKLNIWMTLIIFVVILINFFTMNKLNKDCKIKLWNPLTPIVRKAEYLENISTDFSYAKEIRMFNLSDWFTRKYKKLIEEKIVIYKKNAKTWNRYSFFSNGSWFLIQVISYGWLLYLAVQKDISIGNFSFFISSIAIFFHNTSIVFSETANLLQKSREVNDFRLFMDIMTVEDENKIDVPKYDSWNIEFRNVSFKYSENNQFALKNINLHISNGENLALIGLNGAGKSTFIKLLLGLYVPTEGEILLNGQNIQSFKRESYFKIFTAVFQEQNIFALPIWQNISLATEDARNKLNVIDSLEKVGLQNKIINLSAGIETELLKIITDSGVNLSGGEKQKITIARAIYKEAPCFIFDEPDSSLDALSEKIFYKNIRRLTKTKTTIFISHKLSSVNVCDRIVVFENGKIIECGCKEELLKLNGYFSRIWKNQSKYYQPTDETESL